VSNTPRRDKMNILKVLQKLNLTENIDFVLTESSFVMLPKIRQVSQVIEHVAVAETPAVFDGEVEITPTIPAVEAYSETVLVDEEYVPEAPSLQQMEAADIEVQLDENDIALLISEYLIGKDALRDPENDSINIVNNRIHSFTFTNIPQPSVSELLALIPAVQAKSTRDGKLKQIADLEALVTPRRVRDAVLSGDNSFIQNIDNQVQAIRVTL
jgi:hypothetical protein